MGLGIRLGGLSKRLGICLEYMLDGVGLDLVGIMWLGLGVD